MHKRLVRGRAPSGGSVFAGTLVGAVRRRCLMFLARIRPQDADARKTCVRPSDTLPVVLDDDYSTSPRIVRVSSAFGYVTPLHCCRLKIDVE